MRRKSLSNKQLQIIEDYLPVELSKDKTVDDGMKLVLGNIYRLHFCDVHKGKRFVFRTNINFMHDIEAKQPNDLLRPLKRLISRGYITRKLATEGMACEYSLTDEYYEMLPENVKVSKVTSNVTPDSSKVTETSEPVTLDIIEAMRLEINELKEKVKHLERLIEESVLNSKVTTKNKEQKGPGSYNNNKWISVYTGVDMSTGTRKSDEVIHEELSLNFSSSSKTRSELESEHYDTVVLPQLRRIEQWDENPEPEGYKQISIMSGWNDFPAAAEWFENDIRSKVSDEDWNRYLCIDFNRVKDKYIQIMKGHAA